MPNLVLSGTQESGTCLNKGRNWACNGTRLVSLLPATPRHFLVLPRRTPRRTPPSPGLNDKCVSPGKSVRVYSGRKSTGLPYLKSSTLSPCVRRVGVEGEESGTKRKEREGKSIPNKLKEGSQGTTETVHDSDRP